MISLLVAMLLLLGTLTVGVASLVFCVHKQLLLIREVHQGLSVSMLHIERNLAAIRIFKLNQL